MKLNKKSILALILSLAMAMSLVPFAAFAEDGENAAPQGDSEITVDEEKIEEIVEEILESEAPEEETDEEKIAEEVVNEEAAEEAAGELAEETTEETAEVVEEAEEAVEQSEEETAETPAEEGEELHAEECEEPETAEETSENELAEESAESESVEEVLVKEGEEMLAENINVDDIYEALMACSSASEMETIASILSEEQWNAFSDKQLERINSLFDSFFADIDAVEEMPQPEEIIYREHASEIVTLAKSYTNAVPMFNSAEVLFDGAAENTELIPDIGAPKLLKSVMAPSKMMLKAGSAPLQSTDPSLGDTVDNNGLELRKYIQEKSDGSFDITLEAWTTGTVVTTQTVKPVDIILVIDQSGSMEFDFTQSGYQALVGKTADELASNITNLYVELSDDQYSAVTVNKNLVSTTPVYKSYGSKTSNQFYNNQNNIYCIAGGEYHKVRVERTGGTGRRVCHFIDDVTNVEFFKTEAGTNDSPYPGPTLYQLSSYSYTYNYTFTYTDANNQNQTVTVIDGNEVVNTINNLPLYQFANGKEPRLDALVKATTKFVNQVANKSDETNRSRIAVVGFSSSGYDNNEILTGVDITNGTYNYGTSPHDAGWFSNAYYYPKGYAKNGIAYMANSFTDTYKQALNNALQDVYTSEGKANVMQAIESLTAHGGTEPLVGLDMASQIFENLDQQEATTDRQRVVIMFTDGQPDSRTDAQSAIQKANVLKNAGVKVYTIGIFDGADPTSAGSSNSSNDAVYGNWFLQNVSSNDGIPAVNGQPSYYLSAVNSSDLTKIFTSIASTVGAATMQLSSSTKIVDEVTPYFSITGLASDVIVQVADYNGTSFGSAYTPTGNAITTTVEDGVVNVTGFDFNHNFCASTGRVEGNTSQLGNFHGRKLVITFNIKQDPNFWGGNDVPTNTDESGVYLCNSDGTYTLTEAFEVPDINVNVKAVEVYAVDTNIYYSGEKPEAATLFSSNVPSDWQSNDMTAFVQFEEKYSKTSISNTEDDVVIKTISVTKRGDTDTVYNSDYATAETNVFTPEASFVDSSIYWSQTPNYNDNTGSLIWAHGTGDSRKTSAEVPMSGSAPTVSYNYNKAAAAFTECTTVTGYPVVAGHQFAGSAFTVHVYVPQQNFKDSIIYSGNTPSFEDNKDGEITWIHLGTDNENTTPAGDAPVVTFAYDTNEEALYDCTEVTPLIKVGGNVCSAAKTNKFTVHVLYPTITWKDTERYYGETIDLTAYAPVSITWSDAAHNKTAADATNGQAAPTLSYTFDQNGEMMLGTDVPVAVTVKIGDVDITSKTTHEWKKCSTDVYNALPAGNQFLIHPKFCTLTVSKSWLEAIDENQACIFTVTGGNVTTTVTVAIEGNNSVTIGHLPIGSYTVTEDDNWSWRYDLTQNGSATLSATSASTTCALSNSRKYIYWLNGCSYAVNVWTDGGINDTKKSAAKKGGQ